MGVGRLFQELESFSGELLLKIGRLFKEIRYYILRQQMKDLLPLNDLSIWYQHVVLDFQFNWPWLKSF